MEPQSSFTRRSRVGLILGPLLLAVTVFVPPPSGLPYTGWLTAGVAALMATWWICESIPIPATALLPVALFPLLEIGSIGESATPYANPIIFLFLGGFLIATAMQKWMLHKRIALHIIRRTGTSSKALLAGFMLAAAFLSMWVSNTATALMMLPVGLSVVQMGLSSGDPRDSQRFAVVLLLSIAYGANIGGMGTLIGTPPNALLAGFVEEQYGQSISFARWLGIGLPMVVVGLPVVFLLLTRVAFRGNLPHLEGGRALIDSELAGLGRMSRGELSVAVVFSLTALLWISRPLLNRYIPELSDAGIAMVGGIILFVIPVNLRAGKFVNDWQTARQLPWGTLILFGGGLSLAHAFTTSGLSHWVGESLQAVSLLPVIFVLVVVVAVTVFLTELTSNTATTATFLPILAALAVGIGQNPMLLAVPAVLGASCAFMLPVATPPNAIVYASGRVSVPQMARAGIWLNLAFITIITTLAYSVFLAILGVEVGVIPDWAM